MKPLKEKVLIGADYLWRELGSSAPITIALDLETSGLKVHRARVTWLSWCTGTRYGAIPILHRNFVSADQNLSNFVARTTASVCKCEQGSALLDPQATHTPTFLCKNWDSKEIRDLIREMHSRENITVVWHNASFDLSVLVANKWLSIDEINTSKIDDTLLMSYLLNPVKSREGGEHGLKQLYDAHLRHPDDSPQPTFEDVTNGREYVDVSIDTAGYYAAFDAFTTFHLYQRVFKNAINADPKLNRYYREIELPHLLTTVELMTTGIRLLPQRELKAKGLPTLADLEAALEAQKLKIFKLTGVTFNFDSPDELRRVLLRKCGMRSRDWSQKSGKSKIDTTTLAKMYRSERRQENRKVLAHVMYAKRLTEVLKKHREMYKYVDAISNREYASFRPTTASGRYAVSQPNLLSLPRVTKIKQYLEPEPGNIFVIADFSQVDLRAIANETWEIDPRSKMLASVNRGDDLHTSTLRIVCPDLRFPENWVKLYEDKSKSEFGVWIRKPNGSLEKMPLPADQRLLWEQVEAARKDVAKQVNFGISYGLSDEGLLDALNNPKDFKDGLVSLAIEDAEDPLWLEHMMKRDPKVYTLDEVQGFLEKFHAAYPGIRQFQKLVEDDLRNGGKTYNLFGKLCRAETARFMAAGTFDVTLGYNNWYRVRIKTLKIDSKFVYGILLQVNELAISEPRKGTPDLLNLIRTEGYEVYRLDSTMVEALITNFAIDGDSEKLFKGLDRIHAEANWSASSFLSKISASEPFWKNRELTHVACFPFIKMTHYQIKFVWDDEGIRSFIYPTFSKLKRNLVSARIQSASMDFCKIAMFTFRRKSKERWPDEKLRPRIVNCIHDEIAVECKVDQEDEVKSMLVDSMSNKANFSCYVAKDRKLEVEIGAEEKSGLNYKGDK